MNHSPVKPAHLSRLDAADEEIKRRKQEVLDGVMAALQAQAVGADQPSPFNARTKGIVLHQRD